MKKILAFIISITSLAETLQQTNQAPRKLKVRRDDSRNILFKIEKNKHFTQSEVAYTDKSIIIDKNAEYFYDDFYEYSILSPKFTAFVVDGKEFNNSFHHSTSLWKAKINNFDVTLGMNDNYTLDFLDVFDELNRSASSTFVSSNTAATWSNTIKGGVHRNLGKAYTSFQHVTDTDAKNMSYSMTFLDSVADSTPNIQPYDKTAYYNIEAAAEFQIGNEDNYHHGTFDKLISDNICVWYRQIDVAVAFDSTFCASAGGDATKAIAKIQNIVGITANKYRQAGLCMTIQISAIEGHCDPSQDPYIKMSSYSGCDVGNNKVGILYDFADFWMKHRTHIPRDVVHLFTARTFLDEYTGCSYIGTLCNDTFSYAVESMTFSKEVLMQSVLFAHELGHNCGAWHYMEGSGYIMNSHIDMSPFGFSPETINQMQSYLKSQHCLSTVFY